jgi:hypothetical protein
LFEPNICHQLKHQVRRSVHVVLTLSHARIAYQAAIIRRTVETPLSELRDAVARLLAEEQDQV